MPHTISMRAPFVAPLLLLLAGCFGGADTVELNSSVPGIGISVSAAQAASEDAGAVTFTVALDQVSSLDMSVEYQTESGTATPGVDYAEASGVLTIPAGELSATVDITLVDDSQEEGDETFTLSLNDTAGATITTRAATVTIVDDDSTPPPIVPALSIQALSIAEGDAGTTDASVRVTLDQTSTVDVSVDYSTSPDTASAGSDYTDTSGTLTIPAGSTQASFVVAVQGDTVEEGNEIFDVTLSNPVNAAIAQPGATVTIVDDDSASAPPVSVSIASSNSPNEGAAGAALGFNVTLDQATTLDVLVNWSPVSGSATAGTDFAAVGGQLIIPAGSTAGSIAVAVIDDEIDEPDETMQVQIDSVSFGAVAVGTASATIVDDDPEPQFSISDVSRAEGASGTTTFSFAVTIDRPSASAVSASYATADGTATAPGDYASASGSVSIPAGSQSASIDIAVVGDTVDEGDETFTVVLSSPVNAGIADGSATGTIREDDVTPEMSISDLTVTEGNTGTSTASVEVSLSSPAGSGVSVDYTTTAGTASAGSDFTASSGTLDIPAGESQATIDIAIVGDTLVESDETFTVELSNAQNATLNDASAVVTISNDDSLPAISISNSAVDEGDSGTTAMSFSVSINQVSAVDVSASYATADGTASSPSDYASASGTVTIAAGSTSATVSVDVAGDTTEESDENFTVTLSSPSNATIADGSATGTIRNDDSLPALTISNSAVDEGNSGTTTMSFTVSINQTSAVDVSASYATADGTATSPSDYASASGTVTIPAGSTSATVSVDVTGDTTEESDETFTVSLSSPSNATIADGSATGTIRNDDTLPVMSISDANVDEGDSGTTTLSFTVSINQSYGSNVSASFATSDGSATSPGDYTSASGTVTINAGSTSATINVDVVGDTDEESSETFTVTLSSPSNATLGDASATGTINDDDTSAVSGLDERPENMSCIAPAAPSSNTSVTTEVAFPSLPTLVKPVGLFKAPNDSSRWYVVEQDGRIRSFSDSAGASSMSTFIDISSPGDPVDVDSGPSEGGLFSMAFHPDYGSGNWDVYLSYTIDGGSIGMPLISVLARFESTDNGATLDATSGVELMRIAQRRDNHNGGQIGFGPDGYLYYGLGDGGGSNDPDDQAQNTRTLYGSMLRLDVDSASSPYGIPSDNPFAGNARCDHSTSDADEPNDCPEIYAWGLRNPWRWSFDDATEKLWLGDVGQSRYEEIDIIERGGNYGWRCREAAHNNVTSGFCPDGLIDPVIEFAHPVGESITGGYVYRGNDIPDLPGRYVFGDFISGRIFASVDNGDGTYGYETLVNTSHNIASFAVEDDGELLYLNYGAGNIRRIIPSGGSSGDTIPTLLSATGCVDPSNPTQPADGLIPYDLNAPFWSDGAVKDRYYAIPDGTTIGVDAVGDWQFPIGTVLVKNFRLNGQLFETRLFMRHTNGDWGGYTYEWNGTTDATRVVGGKLKTVQGQEWIYPSETECMQCHTAAAGFSLGLEHGQLNRDLTYPSTGRTANQLVTADVVDLLTAPLTDIPANLPQYAEPTDTSAPLEDRARAYLHSNCAGCHRPSGPTPSSMDLREYTALNQTNTCNVIPNSDDLGIANARIIAPGDASRSLLVQRADRRDVHGMPPIGSKLVDNDGVALLSAWINSLSSCP